MTTLAEMMSSVADVAIGALLDASLPALPAPVVYWGQYPDPPPGCEQNGQVAVWLNDLAGGARFPSPSPEAGCSGPPLVDLTVRWGMCWPVEPSTTSVMLAATDTFLSGTWVIWSAYLGLACSGGPVPDIPRSRLAVVSATPRKPMGGWAALDVQLRAIGSIDGIAGGS